MWSADAAGRIVFAHGESPCDAGSVVPLIFDLSESSNINITTMIEILEPRIAPAVVTINAALKTATWIDYDGDFITMKWSSLNPPAFTTENKGLGLLVDRLDLVPASHSNATFTITVATNPGGDGRLEFGRVAAVGVPLTSWTSPAANIAEFDCGNGTKAITTLVMGSLGAIPHSSFVGNGGDGASVLSGGSGILSIRGDIGAASLVTGPFKSLTVLGSVRGDSSGGGAVPGQLILGTNGAGIVTITGSVIGGDAPFEGVVSVLSHLTSFTVKGNIMGGASANSGGVVIAGAGGNIAAVTVLGSIIGGPNSNSGALVVTATNTVAKMTIGGNIIGGASMLSGYVNSGPVSTFTLGGSLVGGTVEDTGDITLLRAGTVTIKGSIIGGRGTNATANSFIGTLNVTDNLRTLVLNGDIIAGTFAGGTQVGYNGAILVGKNLIGATIKGSLLGNPDHQAIILAGGAAPVVPADYAAIGRLTILGSVSHSYIASGHTPDLSAFTARVGNAENPDAGIGPVLVNGDWTHSSLNGGLNDGPSNGIDLADTHSPGDPARTARMAAVIIKGHILDNPLFSGVSGFAATKLASLTAGGVLVFKTGDPNHSLDPFNFVDVFET